MLQAGTVAIAPSPHWKRREVPPSPQGRQSTSNPVSGRHVTLVVTSMACLALGITCLMVTLYVKQHRVATVLQQLVTAQANWTAAVVENSVQSKLLTAATMRLVILLTDRHLSSRRRRKWKNKHVPFIPTG